MIRLQQTGRALGSEVVLTIIVSDESSAGLIFENLWTYINTFEDKFSRFKPTSELTSFNKNAGQSHVISDEFSKLLSASKAMFEATDGLYSPFILPALQTAGYKGSWPNPDKFDSNLDLSKRQATSSPDDIKITNTTANIPPDTAIEFGGIGKGYLLDQLANYLDTKHVKHYWLSLGGDIICAGFDTESEPWQVGIAHATDEGKLAGSVINLNGQPQAIATSGITKRKGADWHHIIDPRTCQPAKTDLYTATVISSSATEADVFAKCLVILGSSASVGFINKHKIPAALLQVWDNDKVVIKKYGDDNWA